MFIRINQLLNKWYILLLPLVIYLIISISKLDQPGVYFDEVLFLNASLGAIDNTSVFSKIGNIPFYLYPYIGALKAYLYFPIFQYLPVSAYSIRLPVILLTCISLYILFESLKTFFNNKIAFLTLLLLSINPIFINLTRIDTGPNALEFFLKTCSLFFCFRFLKNRHIINLLFLFIFLSLGLFNKLNFIWLINALFIGMSVIYGKFIFLSNKKANFLNILILLVSYLTLLSWFITVGISHFSLEGSINISSIYIESFIGNLQQFISEESFFKIVYQSLPSNLGILFSIISLIGFIFGIRIYYSFRDKLSIFFRNNIKFILLIYIFILLQILFTPLARSSWHYFSLFPFYEILVSSFLYIAFKYQQKIGFSRKLIFIFGLILIIYPLMIDSIHVISFGKKVPNIYWSNKIYDLINYTKSKNNKFVSLNWGTHNQLIGFDHVANKYKWVDINSKDGQSQISKYFDSKTNFILYGKYKSSSSLLSDLAKKNKVILIKIFEIKDKDEVIFEIYGIQE